MSDSMIEDDNKDLNASFGKLFVSLLIEGQEKVIVNVKRKSELVTELEKLKK